MPRTGLGDKIGLLQTERAAVSIGDVALDHFALALGAQERRVDQDEAPEIEGASTRHDGGGHAAHRVTEQNRTRELEAATSAPLHGYRYDDHAGDVVETDALSPGGRWVVQRAGASPGRWR